MVHHPSFGATLGVDLAGGTSYTTIPQVMDITGPGISRGSVDVTAHDSPDGYREFVPGLADGGEVGFELGWDPGTVTHTQVSGSGILSDFEADGCTLAAWELDLHVCSGTVIWTFDGFLTGAEGAVPIEGQLTQSITIKISGKPVVTAT